MMKYILILTLLFISASVGATEKEEVCDTLECAKAQAHHIGKTCWDEAYKDDPYSTADMRRADFNANDCMYKAVEEQVRQAFEPTEQEQVLEWIMTGWRGVSQTYWMIFNNNKYCYGRCGTMQHLRNTPFEAQFLEQVLAWLIHANAKKGSI